jgi:hypothetical protein
MASGIRRWPFFCSPLKISTLTNKGATGQLKNLALAPTLHS